jgi:hypothetical protein
MRRQWALLLFLALTLGNDKVRAENMDPTSNASQYAYAENVGWINAEPLDDGGPGAQVDDFELTGWMWGENTGWISLSCENTSTCHRVRYGVGNDTYGRLSGFAWAENVGWINFAPSGSGVQIDPATGEFSGRAWGENIGWITFGSSGPVAYTVRTAWRCAPNPGPVGDSVRADHDPVSGATSLTWMGIQSGPTHYNSYRGTIPTGTMGSRASPYDHQCYESDDSAGDGVTRSTDFALPAVGTAFYYLVSEESGCEGPLGNASDGRPRPNFSACPTPP